MPEETGIMSIEERVLARWTPADLEIIRATVARHSTDEELYAFLYICMRLDLDPFLKEAWCYKVPKEGEDPEDADAIICASVDGINKIASRSPGYVGPAVVGVVRRGESFAYSPMLGTVDHVAGAEGEIVGGWGRIKREGVETPMIYYIPIGDMRRASSKTWQNNATQMVIARLSGYVTRKMFCISGVVALEEVAGRTHEELAEDAEVQKANLPRTMLAIHMKEAAVAILKAKGYSTRKINERAIKVIGDEARFLRNAITTPIPPEAGIESIDLVAAMAPYHLAPDYQDGEVIGVVNVDDGALVIDFMDTEGSEEPGPEVEPEGDADADSPEAPDSPETPEEEGGEGAEEPIDP